MKLVTRTLGRAKLPPRKELVWTLKIKLIFVLAVLLQIALSFWLTDSTVLAIILFIVLSFVHFIFLIVASVLLLPFDFAAKKIIVRKATRKISKFRDLKIIGITGSYGKTTMKEALAAVLAQKFKVLKTPENINTPLGISRLILKELSADIEIFIVEMGAYKRGDIRALCEIARPDISILAGINEAHLERFGSLSDTIRAKFEIVENARDNALIVLNSEDERVKQNYQKYLGARKVLFYSREDDLADFRKIDIPILGEYIWGVVSACVIIARELGMNPGQIGEGITKIKPVPHRLEMIRSTNDVIVIDDSYNGNPDGAREAVKVLSRFPGRRKIYVTPGLVEMGTSSSEIHREIGHNLNSVADLVVLIKNSVTPFIAEELPQEKIIWFSSAQEAHSRLREIIQPGDVILFQNDWPDNYL